MADILDVDQALAAIGSLSNSSARPELADLYVPAATEVVEGLIGSPVVQREITEDLQVGNGALVLTYMRVSSVTVTQDGATVSGLTVDGPAGVVKGLGSGIATVTYTTGVCDTRDSIPAAIAMAARIILRQNWQADHQAARSRPEIGGGQVDPTTVQTGIGYAVPRRALELLAPWLAGPGIG